MAVTRLERKGQKNVARAKAAIHKIKRLNFVPPIKNVDVEAIKKEFENKNKKTKKSTTETKTSQQNPVSTVAEQNPIAPEEDKKTETKS